LSWGEGKKRGKGKGKEQTFKETRPPRLERLKEFVEVKSTVCLKTARERVLSTFPERGLPKTISKADRVFVPKETLACKVSALPSTLRKATDPDYQIRGGGGGCS